MSNLSTQLSYLLRIAIDINKKIGGTKAYQAQKKAKDKFSVLKDEISKKIYVIRNAIQRKPTSKGLSSWPLQQDQELRERLRQVNSCLIRIRQSVQQQKSNQTSKDLKMQIIQKLQQQYKSYQRLIYGNQQSSLSQRASMSNKHQTLTEMRSHLLTDNNDTTVYSSKNHQKRNLNQQATQIQMEKMAQWKREQEDIDGNVDAIIEKTVTLKSTINQTGKLVNQIDAKVKQLTTNVENLTDDLTKSNRKLKGVVEKFRRPHKFCCDIILTIILIGLIVGIIKVSSS